MKSKRTRVDVTKFSDDDENSDGGEYPRSRITIVNDVTPLTDETIPLNAVKKIRTTHSDCPACVYKLFKTQTSSDRVLQSMYNSYHDNKDCPGEKLATIIVKAYYDYFVDAQRKRGETDIIPWTDEYALEHIFEHDVDRELILRQDIRQFNMIEASLKDRIHIKGGTGVEIDHRAIVSLLNVNKQKSALMNALFKH